MTLVNQQVFLEKYNISSNLFNDTGLDWNSLNSIFEDYSAIKSDLINTAKLFYEILINAEKVNSVKFRLKDGEHLIEKIIRKKIEKPNLIINVNNYRDKITDLIGIRALHLFKEDWEIIHEFILRKWKLKNKPEAYIKKGDHQEYIDLLKNRGCTVKEHPFGYRSVHYTAKSSPTANLQIAEIQVRTIFEEGWSEVDHSIRYPYDKNNPLLGQYLLILNSVANSADQMSSYIRNLKNIEKKYNSTIRELSTKVEKLSKKSKSKVEINRDIHKFFHIKKDNIFIPNQIQTIPFFKSKKLKGG